MRQIVLLGSLLVLLVNSYAQGELLWRTNVSVGSYSSDAARFCELDSAGNTYVCGDAESGAARAVFAVKFSPEGAVLWQFHFATAESLSGFETATCGPDGALYVVGRVLGEGPARELRILKLSPAGVPVWTNALVSSNYTWYSAASIVVDTNNFVRVVGHGTPADGVRTDVYLMTLSPAGARVSFATLGRADRYDDSVLGAAVDPGSGSTYATLRMINLETNQSSTVFLERWAFVKFSAAGGLEWLRPLPLPPETNSLFADRPSSVLLSRDTGIYFTFAYEGRPALRKYDSSGTLVWQAVYDGPSLEQARSAVVDLFGNVTLCSAGKVIHFDRLGTQRWVADIPYATQALLAVDDTQSLFLRARIQTNFSANSLLLTRFEGDGSRRWSEASAASNNVILAGFRALAGRCAAAETWAGGFSTYVEDAVVTLYTTNAGALGPVILSFSSNYAGFSYETVPLSVSAVGTGALSYQWFRNGVLIDSATNATLHVALANGSGGYSVQVADAVGSSHSAEVRLAEVKQMADQQVVVGGRGVFTVRIVDLQPRRIVWRHNGVVLAGQSNLVLNVDPAASASAGTYSVELDFGNGNVLSHSASLAVSDQVAMVFSATRRVFENRTPRSVGMVLDGLGNVVVLNGGSSFQGITQSDLLVYGTNGALTRIVPSIGYNILSDRYGRIYTAAPNEPPWNVPIWVQQHVPPEQEQAWFTGVSAPVSMNARDSLQAWVMEEEGTSFMLDQYRVDRNWSPPNGFAGFALFRIEPDGTTTNLLNMGGAIPAAPVAYNLALIGSNDLALTWVSNGISYLSRYSRAGALRWTVTVPSNGWGFSASGPLLSDANENLILAGQLLSKWDSSGNLLWSRQLVTSGPAVVDHAGNVFVAGYSLSKYDANGQLLWVHPRGAQTVKLDDRGNAYIAERVSKSDNTTDLVIRKIDINGIARWEATYNSEFDREELLAALEVESEGVVYIAGRPDFGLSTFVAKFVERSSQDAPVLTNLPLVIQSELGGSLQVAAPVLSGSGLSYQWLWEGAQIDGATNATLSITNFQAYEAGGYAVRVQNAYGATTSRDVWVINPVRIYGAALGGGDNPPTFAFDINFRYNYSVQWSSNLTSWSTYTNYTDFFESTITVPVSGSSVPGEAAFFRVLTTR